MVEVCRKLLEERNWRAGFVEPSDKLQDDFAAELATHRNCLAVVDYAETKRSEVIALVRAALKAPPGRRVRLVLLARGGGDWWEKLPEQARELEVQVFLGDLDTATGPYRIPPLQLDGSERQLVFDEAVRAFRPKTRCAVADPPAPDLAGEHFGQVLFVHLAALAALHDAPGRRGRSVGATLRRERDYWRRAAASESLDDWHDGIIQAMALLTLAGGARSALVARTLIDAAPRLNGTTPVQRDRVFDLLWRFYQRDGGIDGLRPDLLGERLVAYALKQDDRLLDCVLDKKALCALGNGALDQVAHHSLTVLTRLARFGGEDEEWLRRSLSRYLREQAVRAMEVAVETGEPLARLLTECLSNAQPAVQRGVVNALRPHLPPVTQETVILGELGELVARIHLRLLKDKGPAKR